MTYTLTERYIDATMRSLPPDARDDVRAELTVSIADAIEARTENGQAPEDAERSVLTDLGDPGILAAGFVDRPLHLIGPRFYLTWWRLLKRLWVIVPLAAVGGSVLGHLLSDEPAGGIVGSAITTAMAAVIYTAFWVTVVFAVLERTGNAAALPTWSLDHLPEAEAGRARRIELVPALIFLVLSVGALLWDRFRGFVHVDGEVLPILAPSLWPWWISALVGLAVAHVALAVAVHLSGRWTATAATANTALALAFAIPVTSLLAAGKLINPAFVEFALADSAVDPDNLHTLAIVTGAVIIGVSVWDIVEGWAKALRDRRP